MKIVGLTGGIGTGKSTVAKMLQDQGIDLVDADILSREVVEPGSFGLRAVVSLFGSEILDSSKNQIDRKKLGEKVFSDENNRLILERTLHPLIQWRAQQEFEYLSSIGKRLVIYDAALIFEKNLNPKFDKVIVVTATEEQQFERLSKRDKISKDSIKQRLAAQWSMQSKIDLADYVIDNSKSLDETREQVASLIKKLKN